MPRPRIRRTPEIHFDQRLAPLARRKGGRVPASSPDPWSDLEWEQHPDAQAAVASHPHGMTLEEIGAFMGVTRERVRQIESSAMTKLKTGSGGEFATVLGVGVSIPDCTKCGEPYVRKRGRQTMCDGCEAKRKRVPASPRHEMRRYSSSSSPPPPPA